VYISLESYNYFRPLSIIFECGSKFLLLISDILFKFVCPELLSELESVRYVLQGLTCEGLPSADADLEAGKGLKCCQFSWPDLICC
jgi:hypothetical protein